MGLSDRDYMTGRKFRTEDSASWWKRVMFFVWRVIRFRF